MNLINKKPGALKKSIDTIFWESLEKLEGPHGVQGLVNDSPDLFSILHKAIKDKDGLPEDLNNPKTRDEVEAVNKFAQALYDSFSIGVCTAKAMMVGDGVQREFDNIMDEMENTRD